MMRPCRRLWAAVWVIGAALLLLALFTADAHAQEPTRAPLGQETWKIWPDPPAILNAALAAADASWQTEDGVTEGNYCPVEWRWHEGWPDAGAIASYCIITWNPETIARLITPASGAASGSERHEALVRLCATIKHERGHILGYPDYGPQGGGIMTADLHWLRPLRCTEWADSLVPEATFVPPQFKAPYVPPARPAGSQSAPTVAPTAPSGPPRKGLGSAGERLKLVPCRSAACKARARSFERRRKAALCARAAEGATVGARTPRFCR